MTEQAGLPASTLALLDAVAAISSDLDLRSVLTRIVESAARLTGARYGALSVVGDDSFVTEFRAHDPAAPGRPRLDDPADDPPPGSFLGVPIRIRGTVFGTLHLTEKQDGRPFSAHDGRLVEALASTAGVVIDNARAYGLSERRRRWLEASAELAEALEPPVELAQALAEVAASARSMAHAAAAAVLRMEDGYAVHTVDADPRVLDRTERALEVLESEPWPTADAAPTDVTLGDFTATLVPLRTHLVAAGLLVILVEHGTPPTSYDERALLATFADQAGLALDRAQAIEDRAEHAVTADRERIARDLHDVVIQRLFATGLQLQGAAAMAADPELTERLDRTVEALDLTIRDIRGTIFQLQHQHHQASLRAELYRLVGEYAPLLKFEPVVRSVGPIDTAVPTRVREQLLPVLREALSNLARHAAAAYGEVELAVDEREVRLTVHDDGVGVSPEVTESGLRNARRRATSLGGALSVTPRSPRGTSFVWRVPIGG